MPGSPLPPQQGTMTGALTVALDSSHRTTVSACVARRVAEEARPWSTPLRPSYTCGREHALPAELRLQREANCLQAAPGSKPAALPCAARAGRRRCRARGGRRRGRAHRRGRGAHWRGRAARRCARGRRCGHGARCGACAACGVGLERARGRRRRHAWGRHSGADQGPARIGARHPVYEGTVAKSSA